MVTCRYCTRGRYQYPQSFYSDRIIPCLWCIDGIVPELGGEA